MIQVRTSFDDKAITRLTEESSGKLLLKMAVQFQTFMKDKLAVHNPPPYTAPSVVGEYLRKRTGWLQQHIVIEPTSVARIGRQGWVRVGYGLSAFYGAVWDANRKRKGLREALAEILPKLMGP